MKTWNENKEISTNQLSDDENDNFNFYFALDGQPYQQDAPKKSINVLFRLIFLINILALQKISLMLNDQTNKKRNIRFCIHKKKFCQDDKLKIMAKSTLLVLAKTITWVKLRNLN